MKNIDAKLILLCLINDYLLIADLHIFVYGHEECASISLKCTKVKLLRLYNFGSISFQALTWTSIVEIAEI